MLETEIPSVKLLYERWVELAPSFCENSDLVEELTKESTNLIISSFSNLEEKRVLDIACGAGNPTLSLATRVGKNGEVVGLDFIPKFVEEVKNRAIQKKLKGVFGKIGNSLNLPFKDESFDAISCRFGMQYLNEDLKIKQIQEAYRVLKKGGEFVFVDWGEKGHGKLKKVFLDVLTKCQLTADADKASTDFNFVTASEFARLIDNAGFLKVESNYAKIHWHWNGTPESYWSFNRKLSPQMDKIFANVPKETADKIHEEIHWNIRKYYNGSTISIPTENIILKGWK